MRWPAISGVTLSLRPPRRSQKITETAKMRG
jgi:hypothetical protein